MNDSEKPDLFHSVPIQAEGLNYLWYDDASSFGVCDLDYTYKF